jgi:hypothetical protein
MVVGDKKFGVVLYVLGGSGGILPQKIFCIFRGVYSSIIPPPPGVGGKNQRVLELGKKIKEE